MPFNVLKCHECGTFQVHPQTKGKKWRCKMCSENQSFLKVYMVGSAPDCRRIVQEMNMKKGESEIMVTSSVQDSQPGRMYSLEQDHPVSRLTESQNTWQDPETAEVRKSIWAKQVSQQRSFSSAPSRSAADFEQESKPGESKWSKYIDNAENSDSSSDDEFSIVGSCQQRLYNRHSLIRK